MLDLNFFFFNFDLRFARFLRQSLIGIELTSLGELACKPGGYKLMPPHLAFVGVLMRTQPRALSQLPSPGVGSSC